MSGFLKLPQLLVPSAPFDKEPRDVRAVFRWRMYVCICTYVYIYVHTYICIYMQFVFDVEDRETEILQVPTA